MEIDGECGSYIAVINTAKDLEEYVWNGTVPKIVED